MIYQSLDCNEYPENKEMQKTTNLTTAKCQEFFLLEKVGPFNTTWLFYKPRKITIYYDDRTLHIAAPANKGNLVNDHSRKFQFIKFPFQRI